MCTVKKTVLCILSVIPIFSLLCACSFASRSCDDEVLNSLEARLQRIEASVAAMESENDSFAELLSEASQTDASIPSSSTTEDTEPLEDVSVGFEYEIEGNRAIITGYRGEQVDLVIPATIDGYRVVSIADSAFAGAYIKSVIVSDGVENVGWFAFNGCAFLCSVTLPNSVTSIGHSAFGSGASITLYCHSGSFAASYAKSYGISYVLI